MTGVLELAVEGDGKWPPLPVWEDDDPQPWAEDVVDEYARRRRVRCRAQARTVVVQAWSAMVEDVRERRDEQGRRVASALGFVPMGSTEPAHLVPMAVAHLCGVESPGGRDGLVDALVQSPEQRIGDPLVEEVATSSGEALRVRQLLLAPLPEHREHVGLSLVYVWEAPVPGMAITLDAWFDDPGEGALVMPSFDALAATLTATVT